MADHDHQLLIDTPHGNGPTVQEPIPESSPESGVEPNASAIATAAHFLRASWIRVCVSSALLLIPCFWHRHIEAGDLASHTYNAWLTQLIERGQAPGLWLSRQWNNIFFDTLLLRLGNLFGLDHAEKIAVSLAVLIFFWGAFALVNAMTRRIPWVLVPCLMIFAYGWTFQMGFLNYYISLGLAFFGMAMVASGSRWQLGMLLVLAPLTWMAHPLGLVLLLGGSAYLVFAKRFARRGHWLLLGAAGLSLASISIYISSHYQTIWPDIAPYNYPHNFSGVDQLVLYGTRYTLLSNLLLIFILACLASDIIPRLRALEALTPFRVPLQIYIIAVFSAMVFPRVIFFPQYAVPFSLLTERLTSITAILGCCLLGVMAPKKWHFAGFSAFAAVFFLFLFLDTGKINRMELQAERYERILPPGQRIIATIWPFSGSRVFINHIVDRSCAGYCFSYGNYEPSSQQFRVRANPGNPIVTSSSEMADAIQSGEYVVQPGDLPIFQIYQCNLNMTELCMRELAPGEKNGREGLHPAANSR
jgi:hypothetical protein